MAYDSGIRKRQANANYGIHMCWESSGSALSNGTTVWLIQISGAGELKVVRFFSKSAGLVHRVYNDSYALVEALRYRPSQLYASYGCCGNRGGLNLVKYDTVANKYITEFYQSDYLGGFGYSADVGFYNDTGAAVNCCLDAIYGVNASLAVRQDHVDIGKLNKGDLRGVAVARADLAKALKLGLEDITMVKAGYFDEKAGQNVDTLEAFVHPGADAAGEKLVKEFLAQFV